MALHLLHAINTVGYAIIASADTSAKYVHQQNGPDYPMDVHSWFIIRSDVYEKVVVVVVVVVVVIVRVVIVVVAVSVESCCWVYHD